MISVGLGSSQPTPQAVTNDVVQNSSNAENDISDMRITYDQVSQRLASISSYSVRPDSKLIKKACAGELPEQTVEQVARELATIQYLYDQTSYGTILETRMREIADEVKRTHPMLPWGQVWEIVKELGPGIVKCEALFYTQKEIPDGYGAPTSNVDESTIQTTE